MTLQTLYFESLGALLDAIDATPRHPNGSYKPQGPGGSTISQDTQFYGRPLEQMVQDSRAMLPFASAISTVEALANQLSVQLPAPRSVKRRRVRRDEGDFPDVDRMLAGDLEHAWTTTRKLLHDDPTASTTIIVPTGYASTTPQSVIFWNMAATLSLAALLEQSGRRTCLVALEYGQLCNSADQVCVITVLKDSHEPWSLQEAIVTTDKAYLRRLMFRLQDCMPNPPSLGYSYVAREADLRAHITTLAEDYHWRHWILGAHPGSSNVWEEKNALDWITHQLTVLEGVAVL